MPPQQPPVVEPSSLSKNMRVRRSFLIVLCVLIAFTTGYVYLQVWLAQNAAVEMPLGVEEPTTPQPEELSGKIYMSLAPVDGGGANNGLDIYSYDPKADEFSQETDSENREFYTSKISPDGKKMAVAAISNADDEATARIELFVRDLATGDSEEVRTLETLYEKRNPTWSSDGTKVAFAAKLDEATDLMIPESWSIYVYQVGTDTYAKHLTEGANPIFLPDGNLAVLKRDGIHYVNVATGESTRTPLIEGVSYINTKFDVLRDGSKIAFAIPANDEVFVVPVTSWAPFEMGEGGMIIPTPAFWPLFSPQGDYLAMQVIDWAEKGTTSVSEPTDQRLAIFSLRDNTWISSLDLMPYVQDRLFITDWVR